MQITIERAIEVTIRLLFRAGWLRAAARQQSWPVVLPHPGMLPDGLGIASSECSRRGVTLSIGDPFGIRVLRPEGSVTWGHLTIIHRGEP